MGQKINQFCEDLRVKLTSIDNDLGSLKLKVDTKVHGAEEEARSHLAKVQQRIDADRSKVAAANAEMKKWVDDRKAVTAEKIAEWKVKREASKLQNRAEKAERNATAAIAVALAAVDDAELAALEAWLARKDADAAAGKKAA